MNQVAAESFTYVINTQSQQCGEYPTTEEGPNCPHCGSAMVKRIGRRGQYRNTPFWGCSSFPSCRGVMFIDEADCG